MARRTSTSRVGNTPIHPTRQLLPDLPVFEFAAPFVSAYPPYSNLARIFGLLPLAPLLDRMLPARRTLAALLVLLVTSAGAVEVLRNAGSAATGWWWRCLR